MTSIAWCSRLIFIIISGRLFAFSAAFTEMQAVKIKKTIKKADRAGCRFIVFSFGCACVGLRRVTPQNISILMLCNTKVKQFEIVDKLFYRTGVMRHHETLPNNSFIIF
jgi:hypothetical protein